MQMIREHAPELGTLIMEPMIGDGYLPPVPGFLQMIRAVCDECDVVLVFDEAITQSPAGTCCPAAPGPVPSALPGP